MDLCVTGEGKSTKRKSILKSSFHRTHSLGVLGVEPLDASALDMDPDADLELGDGVGGDADGDRGVLRVDVVQGAEVEGTPGAAVDQLPVPLLHTRKLEGDHSPELTDSHVHREPLRGSGGLGINLK